MDHGLSDGKAVLAVGGLDGAARLQLFQCQGARAVVRGGQELECLDQLGLLANSQEVLGRLAQSHDRDAEHGHDEDNRASGEHDISPSPVAVFSARLDIGTVPLLGHHKSPGDESRHGLANAPPASEKSEQPLLVAGEVLEENGRVHDEIASGAEAEQGYKEAKGGPVGHGTGNDTSARADEEGDVEGVLAANHVGAEAPKQGSKQHADVGCDGETICVSLLAKLLECLSSDDGLEEGDHRVHSIASMDHQCQRER